MDVIHGLVRIPRKLILHEARVCRECGDKQYGGALCNTSGCPLATPRAELAEKLTGNWGAFIGAAALLVFIYITVSSMFSELSRFVN